VAARIRTVNKRKDEKMKKIVVILMAVFLISTLMAGCGSKSETTGDTASSEVRSGSDAVEQTAQEEAKPAGISFFHWRNEDKAAYDEVLENFQKANPNIKVNMEIIPTEDYYKTLTMRVFGGEAGDIFAIHPGGELFNVVKAGAYMDLSDQKDILDCFDEAGLQPGQVNGKQYALVQTTNALAMYYNKGMFSKYGLQVPKTWEEFLNVCETLKKNNITPITIAVGEVWVPEFFYLSLDVNIEKDLASYVKVGKGELKITEMEGVKNTLEMMRELRSKGYISKDASGTKYDPMVTAFAQGKAAMMPTGTWSMNSVRSQNPDIDFGVFNPPSKGGTVQKGVSVPGLLFGINAGTQQPEASLLFAKYMISPDAMNIICNKTAQLGVSKGITFDNLDLQMASAQLSGPDGSYHFMFHDFEFSQVQDNMNNLIVENLVNDKATIEELTAKYQAEIDNVLAAANK
jgi:raffinose/stachyose/melibiose transport system substrate-binding protein